MLAVTKQRRNREKNRGRQQREEAERGAAERRSRERGSRADLQMSLTRPCTVTGSDHSALYVCSVACGGERGEGIAG